MSERDGYSGTQLVLAFLAGAAAGAVIALLAGSPKTREVLRGAAGRAAAGGGDLAARLRRAGDAGREAFRAATHRDPR